jgi:hypothetical protein
MHSLLGTNSHIFIEYVATATAYILFYCGFDWLLKKKITFGFNVFLSLWLALSFVAFPVSITTALIIIVLTLLFSGPIYFKLFISPKLKKEIPHEGH